MEKSAAGEAQTLRLQAPFGGGRRALVTEFCKRAARRGHADLAGQLPARRERHPMAHPNVWFALATVTADVLQRGKVELILARSPPPNPSRCRVGIGSSSRQENKPIRRRARSSVDATGQPLDQVGGDHHRDRPPYADCAQHSDAVRGQLAPARDVLGGPPLGESPGRHEALHHPHR